MPTNDQPSSQANGHLDPHHHGPKEKDSKLADAKWKRKSAEILFSFFKSNKSLVTISGIGADGNQEGSGENLPPQARAAIVKRTKLGLASLATELVSHSEEVERNDRPEESNRSTKVTVDKRETRMLVVEKKDITLTTLLRSRSANAETRAVRRERTETQSVAQNHVASERSIHGGLIEKTAVRNESHEKEDDSKEAKLVRQLVRAETESVTRSKDLIVGKKTEDSAEDMDCRGRGVKRCAGKALGRSILRTHAAGVRESTQEGFRRDGDEAPIRGGLKVGRLKGDGVRAHKCRKTELHKYSIPTGEENPVFLESETERDVRDAAPATPPRSQRKLDGREDLANDSKESETERDEAEGGDAEDAVNESAEGEEVVDNFSEMGDMNLRLTDERKQLDVSPMFLPLPLRHCRSQRNDSTVSIGFDEPLSFGEDAVTPRPVKRQTVSFPISATPMRSNVCQGNRQLRGTTKSFSSSTGLTNGTLLKLLPPSLSASSNATFPIADASGVRPNDPSGSSAILAQSSSSLQVGFASTTSNQNMGTLCARYNAEHTRQRIVAQRFTPSLTQQETRPGTTVLTSSCFSRTGRLRGSKKKRKR